MFIPVSPETVLYNNAFPRQEAQVSDHPALLAGSNKALSPELGYVGRLRGNDERRTLDRVESKMTGHRQDHGLACCARKILERVVGVQDPKCSLNPIDELMVEASP